MESQYFYLGLLAAMVAAVGYFARALHVSRVTRRHLSAKWTYLQRELDLQKKNAAESREEAERSSALVRLLEQQVQQQSSEIDALRTLLLRRDQEIRLLREDSDRTLPGESISGQAGEISEEVSALSAAACNPTKATHGREGVRTLISPEEQQALLSPARRSNDWGHAGGGAVQSWKDTMDRMLGVLDAIERKVSE